MTNKITKINADTIITLAQKDLDSYNKNQKSYQLLNWLKDELILRQVHKQTTFAINTKAFAKCVSILSLFRERNLTSLTCNIQDRENIVVKFEFDLTTLSNAEIRRLNNEYDLNLSEKTEDEIDETYAHLC